MASRSDHELALELKHAGGRVRCFTWTKNHRGCHALSRRNRGRDTGNEGIAAEPKELLRRRVAACSIGYIHSSFTHPRCLCPNAVGRVVVIPSKLIAQCHQLDDFPRTV